MIVCCLILFYFIFIFCNFVHVLYINMKLCDVHYIYIFRIMLKAFNLLYLPVYMEEIGLR